SLRSSLVARQRSRCDLERYASTTKVTTPGAYAVPRRCTSAIGPVRGMPNSDLRPRSDAGLVRSLLRIANFALLGQSRTLIRLEEAASGSRERAAVPRRLRGVRRGRVLLVSRAGGALRPSGQREA